MRTAVFRCAALVAALFAASPAFAVDPSLRKQAKDADSFRRSDAARALAKDGTADAAALLAELLEDRSAHVRDVAVEACERISDPAAVAEIAKAAASKDELTRRNAAAALGRTKSHAALAALEKLARKDASPQVRADALDALWDFKGVAEALSIARGAAGDADPFVRAAAIEAVGRVGGDGAADVVRKALTDADAGVRCVARMELRHVARDEANATVVAAAADPSWRVRAQAVDEAAWLREATSVEALLLLLSDPVPRVAGAAHRTLQQLSGRDLGLDADLWKAWWEQNRASWKAPDGKFADLRGDGGAAGASKTGARYHGIGVASDRVVFVLDFSGSMRDPAGRGEPRSRWDVARAELLQVLAAMPDGARTNVLLFQGDTRKCFDRVTALSDRTRKDVESLCRATPGERGNLLGGVLEALRDDDVDTVFLLSDGAPSAGDLVDRSRVQAAIRQVNRTRKVAIHTIGFGAEKSTARAFLEGVARDAGGRCVLK